MECGTARARRYRAAARSRPAGPLSSSGAAVGAIHDTATSGHPVAHSPLTAERPARVVIQARRMLLKCSLLTRRE